MSVFHRTVSASLICLSMALPAKAATDTFCDLEVSRWEAAVPSQIDGFWQVKNGAGTLTMMGRTMPLPPGQASDGAIEAKADGSMMISSQEMQGSFPITFVKTGDMNFDLEKDTPLDSKDVLENQDIEVMTGCKPSAFPRLRATGSYQEEAGIVDFELHLIVISPKIMYGVTFGEFKGPQGAGKAQRLVTFSR